MATIKCPKVFTQQVALLSPHDALCLSVVSFNNTIPRAKSFVISYWGFRFITAYNQTLFCCLRRNVESSCHKHFVVRLQRTTNNDECHWFAAVRRSCVYNTWWTNHWQHTMKADTGRESQFLLNLPVFKVSIRSPHTNIAIMFGMKKLEWCGYPTVKNFEHIFIRFNRIHKRDERTDRQTDRQTPDDDKGCTYV